MAIGNVSSLTQPSFRPQTGTEDQNFQETCFEESTAGVAATSYKIIVSVEWTNNYININIIGVEMTNEGVVWCPHIELVWPATETVTATSEGRL